MVKIVEQKTVISYMFSALNIIIILNSFYQFLRVFFFKRLRAKDFPLIIN